MLTDDRVNAIHQELLEIPDESALLEKLQTASRIIERNSTLSMTNTMRASFFYSVESNSEKEILPAEADVMEARVTAVLINDLLHNRRMTPIKERLLGAEILPCYHRQKTPS